MKPNKPYDVEELIENSGYIDYVLGRASDVESNRWTSYAEQYPEEHHTLNEAKLFIQEISKQEESKDTEVLAEVRANLSHLIQSEKKEKRPRRRLWAIAAAACLGFLFVYNVLFIHSTTTITAKLGQHQSYTLPDGSVVELNAGSEIKYDHATFNKSERVLNMEGQAFFEVEKGTPFIVKTDVGTVEVLGTSFDVYDRKGLFIVGCKTGRVRVTSGTNSTILQPGEEVHLANNTLNKKTKNIDEIGSWEDGTFYFESISLRRILDEVERQFETSITCEPSNLGDQLYTGYFDTGHIDSALVNICWPLRLKFEHYNKSIVVSKN